MKKRAGFFVSSVVILLIFELFAFASFADASTFGAGRIGGIVYSENITGRSISGYAVGESDIPLIEPSPLMTPAEMEKSEADAKAAQGKAISKALDEGLMKKAIADAEQSLRNRGIDPNDPKNADDLYRAAKMKLDEQLGKGAGLPTVQKTLGDLQNNIRNEIASNLGIDPDSVQEAKSILEKPITNIGGLIDEIKNNPSLTLDALKKFGLGFLDLPSLAMAPAEISAAFAKDPAGTLKAIAEGLTSPMVLAAIIAPLAVKGAFPRVAGEAGAMGAMTAETAAKAAGASEKTAAGGLNAEAKIKAPGMPKNVGEPRGNWIADEQGNKAFITEEAKNDSIRHYWGRRRIPTI